MFGQCLGTQNDAREEIGGEASSRTMTGLGERRRFG